MAVSGFVGFSDAHQARLAEIARAAREADAALAATQARMSRVLAAAEDLARDVASSASGAARGREMAQRSIAAEIGAVLRLSDRTVQRRMGAAAELADDYPATLAAWEAGRIHAGHVRTITDAGAALPSERRSAFDVRALGVCESETPGRARRVLTMVAERLHPRSLTDRYVDAREMRGVSVAPLGNGMSHLGIDAPTVLVDGAYDRATRMARTLIDLRAQAIARVRDARATGTPIEPTDEILASDDRTMEQLRADIMADLLLTGDPAVGAALPGDGPGTLGAIRAHVQVVVPVLTLLTGDGAAEIAGREPIDAETARRLAGGTGAWDRILTDPLSGRTLGSDRRLAPPDLRRWVQARDQHCRFPGCTVPAIRCEIDHVVDWAKGGRTVPDNLQALCQRHHSMKQFTGWRVALRESGVVAWTSPLGETYTDASPAPAVSFSVDEPEPPWADSA
ncbi:HNH endonuclease signature motif containing protein [Microbacterium sp. Clip185]|uniref:HNH endonuclease signature motif containing protein n=1 Tax=Microbacterium sp. Clip185 TaxID=3025663 RepID=UPI0023655924|nr:HNH endonuclease signature motif containing protein [Microbacterium sp. Clip185]WDG16835.1 DUF222 domain-containing protein [Microbacterium sp. Clip185]